MGHLIINVDDFGFTEGVNEAVYKLAEIGTISATNIMTNMPYVNQITDVINCFEQLSIGVHINLTQGKPLLPSSQVPTLVNESRNFHSLQYLRKNSRSISPKEIELEVTEQVRYARKLLGERLDHWNSHQGIHRFRPFFGVISQICRQHKIPSARSHRHHFIQQKGQNLQLIHPHLLNIHRFGVKRVLTETYYDISAMWLAQYFQLPNGIVTVEKGNLLTVMEIALKHELPTGQWEIPCHPAVTTDGLSQTAMLQSRLDEYNFLSSDKIRKLICSYPRKLIGFNSI